MAINDVKKEGWSAEKLGEQSSYEKETEIKQRLNRGDETRGDPNERDLAGAVSTKDTPHGREARDKPIQGESKEDKG